MVYGIQTVYLVATYEYPGPASTSFRLPTPMTGDLSPVFPTAYSHDAMIARKDASSSATLRSKTDDLQRPLGHVLTSCHGPSQ